MCIHYLQVGRVDARRRARSERAFSGNVIVVPHENLHRWRSKFKVTRLSCRPSCPSLCLPSRLTTPLWKREMSTPLYRFPRNSTFRFEVKMSGQIYEAQCELFMHNWRINGRTVCKPGGNTVPTNSLTPRTYTAKRSKVKVNISTSQSNNHHHHLEIYSAPITFAAIGAVQKSYKHQQTVRLTNIKSKAEIMGF